MLRVEQADAISRGQLDARLKRASLATVLLKNDLHARSAFSVAVNVAVNGALSVAPCVAPCVAFKPLNHGARAIGRAVVHHDHLHAVRRVVLVQRALDRLAHKARVVAVADENGETWQRGQFGVLLVWFVMSYSNGPMNDEPFTLTLSMGFDMLGTNGSSDFNGP